MPPFYKKRWVMILAIFMVLTGSWRVYDDTRLLQEAQGPSSEELADQIATQGHLAQRDTLFTSQYGFTLGIPSGYQFVERNKDMALLAVKDIEDGTRNAITIGLIETKDEVNTTTDGTLEYLKSINETYEFGAKQYNAPRQRVSVPLEVTKNSVLSKGYFVFQKSDQITYFLLGITGKANWEDSKTEIVQILESFSIKSSQP